MTLIDYKVLIAISIAIITLIGGFASLQYIKRYRSLLSLGDALADGIFLGAAVFHLFPESLANFLKVYPKTHAYFIAIGLIIIGFGILFLFEHVLHNEEQQKSKKTMTQQYSIILTALLSWHAFISGTTLGIIQTISTLSVLFFAMLAHKGFESFALIQALSKTWTARSTKSALWLFTGVTPLGILVGSLIKEQLNSTTAYLGIGLFSGLAAGSFLYIGTIHAAHYHFDSTPNLKNKITKTSFTIIGILLMGITKVWH